MSTYADVLRVAMSLSAKERSDLAHAILESIDAEHDDAPPQLSEAWRAEIARRSAEIDAGTAKSYAWEETRRRVRSRHGFHDQQET